MPKAKVLPDLRILHHMNLSTGYYCTLRLKVNGVDYGWNDKNYCWTTDDSLITIFHKAEDAENCKRRIRRAGVRPPSPTTDLSVWIGKTLRPADDKSFFPPGTKGLYSTPDYGEVVVTKMARAKAKDDPDYLWTEDSGRTWRCRTYNLKIVSIGGAVEQEDELVW
jgi:hypothetical protein